MKIKKFIMKVKMKGEKMRAKTSFKNKLVDTGMYVYIIVSVGVGIFAGKFLYRHLHNSDQPFSLGKAALGVLAGLYVSGVLLALIGSRRFFLPGCTECESGRLHKTEEILETFSRKGGAGKLYYGMRAQTECERIKETISCDRCDYKTVREYVSEGAVTIH